MYARGKTLDLVRQLLICGVYGDSLVAMVAFRILRELLHPKQSNPPAAPVETGKLYTWENKELVNLVDRYAGLYEFARPATPQMIAALPLFCWHRYPLHGAEEKTMDPIVIKVGDEEICYRKPAGKTPLEFYISCLLDEPPESDALNRAILDALKWKVAEIKKKRVCNKDDPRYMERLKEVVTEDWALFEVLRTDFLTIDPKVEGAMDLTKLEDYLAISPNSPERGDSPTAINGYAFSLARTIANWDAFTFADGPTPVFDRAPQVITLRAAKHIVELDKLRKLFQEGRVKAPADWDRVREFSPPPDA
jgi:hypothetical protein